MPLSADRPWASYAALSAGVALPSAGLLSWVYFRWATSDANSLSDIQKPHFPLGSLANWRDLLWMNRRIGAEADPKTGLCVQWLGCSRAYAVTKAKHVEQVLKNSVSRGGDAPSFFARLAMTAGTFHIKMFMGWNSVGVLEGEKWKEVRGHLGKFVQSSLHLKLQFEPIKEAANELVSWFGKPGQPDAQEVSDPLFAMAYDVLSMAVFGESSGFLKGFTSAGEMDPVVHALAETMHEMTRRMGSFNPLDWLYVFDSWRPSQRSFVEAQRAVWTYVKKIVERRRRDQTESFLYHLCQAAASDGVIFDNVQTCMWAGHESTAASLSFILYELSTRPDVQSKLRKEVAEVVGTHGKLEYEHMSRLNYVRAVVDEALRLHPPAIWTNREVANNMDLDGVTLSKGDVVFVPIVAVHRSRLNWDDPDEFRPDRFLNAQPEEGSYVPFGAGRRICPGYKLAPFELRVVLATFVQRGLHVTRQPEDPQPEIRASGAFQLCVKNYLRLTVAS